MRGRGARRRTSGRTAFEVGTNPLASRATCRSAPRRSRGDATTPRSRSPHLRRLPDGCALRRSQVTSVGRGSGRPCVDPATPLERMGEGTSPEPRREPIVLSSRSGPVARAALSGRPRSVRSETPGRRQMQFLDGPREGGRSERRLAAREGSLRHAVPIALSGPDRQSPGRVGGSPGPVLLSRPSGSSPHRRGDCRQEASEIPTVRAGGRGRLPPSESGHPRGRPSRYHGGRAPRWAGVVRVLDSPVTDLPVARRLRTSPLSWSIGRRRGHSLPRSVLVPWLVWFPGWSGSPGSPGSSGHDLARRVPGSSGREAPRPRVVQALTFGHQLVAVSPRRCHLVSLRSVP